MDRDTLISRIIDGEATSEQWQAFRSIAESDSAIWRELSEAQADHEALSAIVDRTIAVADEIELPDIVVPERALNRRLAVVRTWGGWAAAAALLLVWMTGGLNAQRGLSNQAGLGPSTQNSPLTSDEALQAYIDQGRQDGRVIHMVPDRVVVETRPLHDGTGMEVFYIRQILERQVLDEAYRVGRDEAGNQVPVPIEFTRRARHPM